MNRLMKSTSLSAIAVALGVSTAVAATPAADVKANQPAKQTTAQSADAKPVEALEAAAQRLRDAIHALAKAPPGEQRNQAIRDGNRALMEVNDAMAALPPNMLTAQADENAYKQATDRLEQAAQRLRDATHSLAKDQNSPRRNDAINSVNRALHETQQAMIDVPVQTSNTRSAAGGSR